MTTGSDAAVNAAMTELDERSNTAGSRPLRGLIDQAVRSAGARKVPITPDSAGDVESPSLQIVE